MGNMYSKENEALSKEIAKHKRNIRDIEQVLQRRKELEELESKERMIRLGAEHPKIVSAVRKLKFILGQTNKELEKAKKTYKRYVKKHPSRQFSLG